MCSQSGPTYGKKKGDALNIIFTRVKFPSHTKIRLGESTKNMSTKGLDTACYIESQAMFNMLHGEINSFKNRSRCKLPSLYMR